MLTATSRSTSAEYETARADGDTVAVGALAPLSEVEFMELLGELCVDFAPRRFALGEVYGDYDDGRVLAWGMALEGRAVLHSDDGRPIGVFPSAERALARLSRSANLRLVWIDPDSDGEAEAREEHLSKHEKDDPARGDGQRPKDKSDRQMIVTGDGGWWVGLTSGSGYGRG